MRAVCITSHTSTGPDPLEATLTRCEKGVRRIVGRLIRRNPFLSGERDDLRQQAREILIREAKRNPSLSDAFLLHHTRLRLIDWLRVHGSYGNTREHGKWRPRHGDLSLDAELPWEVRGVVTMHDLLPAPEGEVEAATLIAARQALAELSPRERAILVERYTRDRTQEDVAKEMDISASRVSQIERGALAKLYGNVETETVSTEPVPPRKERSVGHGLSPRAQQVLRFSANGLTAKETASRIGIGEETVKTYRKRAIAHYNALNLLHAVALAFRAGDLT